MILLNQTNNCPNYDSGDSRPSSCARNSKSGTVAQYMRGLVMSTEKKDKPKLKKGDKKPKGEPPKKEVKDTKPSAKSETNQ